jgi:glutathione S-transferase
VLLDYGTTMKGADYLAVNPMGKVPAIRHGDTVVTETAAICAYLADAFPDAGLAPPPGHRKRGTYYRWLFFAAGPVEAAITNRALKVEPTAEQQRFVGYGSFEATIDNLENALRPGPYICGDQFTAADVYVGSQIGFGMMFGTVEKRPIFEDYFSRLQARPAAARAREIDDALIAELQAQQPQPQPA